MALNYSFTQANQATADYRIVQRPTPQTNDAKIARLEQWLADRAGAEWTNGYKAAERELKMLREAR